MTTDHRRGRALSRLDHSIERLQRAREALVGATHLTAHAPHLDAMGNPYLVRPGFPAAYEVALDRLVTQTEGVLAILLRDARTST